MEADPLLTRVEAAAFLRVGRSTMANWAVRKFGPRYADYGDSAMYRLSDLIRWRDEQFGQTEPPPAAEKKRVGRPRRVAL